MQVLRIDGLKIREAREMRGLTVDEMRERLISQEGITRHPDTLRNIELRRCQPSNKLAHAIAGVLGVLFEDLLAADGADLTPPKTGTRLAAERARRPHRSLSSHPERAAS